MASATLRLDIELEGSLPDIIEIAKEIAEKAREQGKISGGLYFRGMVEAVEAKDL